MFSVLFTFSVSWPSLNILFHPERYSGVDTLEKWLIDACEVDFGEASTVVSALSIFVLSAGEVSAFDASGLEVSDLFTSDLGAVFFGSSDFFELGSIFLEIFFYAILFPISSGER